jgi:polar amino acid transport system permease protein
MHGLVAVDLHVIWQQVFHPNHIFFRTLWATVYIAVISQALGVVLGLFAALARMSRFAPLRWISGIYVWIFRGTPLLVQIFYVYFAFSWPTLNLGVWTITDAAIAGIVALSINEGAYMREIIRAGIDSVDKGQMEAAKSVGMTSGKAMRRIILPQAARVIVPPLGNEFNNMLKNTALLFTIGVFEMFAFAEQNYSRYFISDYFLAIAVWYLLLTTVWTFIQSWIERRLSVSDRGEELSFWERMTLAWDPRVMWGRGMPWWGNR